MDENGGGLGGDGETAPEWAGLSPDILTNIISRLTLEERWRGPMLVCKSWLTASRDPCLFSTFDLEPWFQSYSDSSTRWWSSEFERRIDSMLRFVVDSGAGNLTDIRVRHCSDRALSYAADRCPFLRVLWTKNCPNITDASMVKIAFRCPRLRELDISYCHEISHDTLAMIGRTCPDLKILKRNLMNWMDFSQYTRSVPTEYLDTCPQDGDAEANAIGNHMPNLEHLEIQFSKLSAKGLASICEGCPKLEYLDLSGCVHLSSRDIGNAAYNLKNLKEMKKPEMYVARAGNVTQTERYGHWRLYDDRFDLLALRI